jgi:hypothetical protein
VGQTFRAVEPDWEEVIKVAERDAWAILNMLYEFEQANMSASKIGLTACHMYERGVSDLQELLSGVV